MVICSNGDKRKCIQELEEEDKSTLERQYDKEEATDLLKYITTYIRCIQAYPHILIRPHFVPLLLHFDPDSCKDISRMDVEGMEYSFVFHFI